MCILTIILLFILIFSGLLFAYYNIYKENEKIAKEFYYDELTTLNNKKYMVDKLTNISEYYHVAIADIDKFKSINDTYGHLTGDHILRFFAKTLSTKLKPKASHLVRYGGEEFIIFYDNQKYSEKEVIGFIDEYRENLSNMDIQLDTEIIDAENLYKIKESMPTIKISSSFGLCTDYKLKNLQEKIKYADAKLYEAKNTGRNKLCY